MTGMLILARQGQNEGDALERFVGQGDYRLTQLGRLEAKGIARQIVWASLSVDAIFAAASRQAEETVHIVRKGLGMPVPFFLDPSLCERDFGDLTNMRKEAALDLYGAPAVVAWKRSFNSAPPSGESFDHLHQRAWSYFNQSIQPHLDEGQNILVVADTDVTRALALGMGELPAAQAEALEYDRGQVIAYVFDESVGPVHRRPSHLRIVA